MRNISQNAIDVLTRQTAIEPVIIVRVYWAGNAALSYCDRKFTESGLIGKLLAISGIEDIINVNNAANSTSLSVTLDDSDGEIKSIFNFNDIHKNYVQILQWFVGLSLTDAFVIFEGEISSPIVWNEGERSLTFDVVTKIEDREVGFSAEEGRFATMPSDLTGVPWPIVFGTVTGLKPLLLFSPPSAILAQGFGILNEKLWKVELDALSASIQKADELSREAYLAGVASALKASHFKGFSKFFKDDPTQADQYDNAAAQYFAQSGEYAQERINITAQLKFQQNLLTEQRQTTKINAYVDIVQNDFPVIKDGTLPKYIFDIGQYYIHGLVLNQKLLIESIALKPIINQNLGANGFNFSTRKNVLQITANQPIKYTWVDGGTELKVINYPTQYIISLLVVEVINVWGFTNNGRTIIPKNYYFVDNSGVGGVSATTIIFGQPLITMLGGWTSNDIEVDCKNTDVGNNIVSIMEWAINNYSRLAIDPTSFGHVGALLNKWPANFVLRERKNLVQFLQELAFQARCAIWLQNRTFYIKYLPEEQTAVDTITLDDIEVNTLQVTSTPTEEIITKFVGSWNTSLRQITPYEIIYRYNVQKYGLVAQSYNFYAYTQAEPVQKAVEFWLIRKSNTWKRLKFKTMLHKLALEMFDTVIFDFGSSQIIANGPVIGIIEKCSFDSSTDSIDIEAWIPVRFGEMERYPFALPMNEQDVYPPINDGNVRTGNPFDQAGGALVPEDRLSPIRPITVTHGPQASTSGRGLPIGDSSDPGTPSVKTVLANNLIIATQPTFLDYANDSKNYQLNPITPFQFINSSPSSFFGFVTTFVKDKTYKVNAYLNGLTKDPSEIEVVIAFLRDGTKLPENKRYPVVVNRTLFKDIQDGVETVRVEFWAQPPVWAPVLDDSP